MNSFKKPMRVWPHVCVSVVIASVFALTATTASPVSASTNTWSQMGSDINGEAANDVSGRSVSMSADGLRMAIGAFGNDGNGDDAGHVRVFSWSNGAWVQMGSDINGEASGDTSGWSVSMSADGSRVAIGATLNRLGGVPRGHVRVYEWNGTAWVKMGSDIDGQANYEYVGFSVSLSENGSRVAIGAPLSSYGDSGAGVVRVYEWNGTAWVQMNLNIAGEGAGDQSGYSVSLSADGARLAVGAPFNDGRGTDSGHVRVYAWDGTWWTQMGSDIDGEAAGDFSGESVSLSADGTRLAIGARLNDGNGENSGHVRVYSWNGTAWVQLGVDIDGEAAGDFSGRSVSLSADGERLAIGAQYNDGNGEDSGHVRVYSWNGTAWVQLGVDINGEAAWDESGRSVSLSADGTRLAIGAFGNDDNGDASGHVRVFQVNLWSQVNVDIDGAASGDQSGFSVSSSADGSRVAVGAPLNDGGGTNAGQVRVYQLMDNAWLQLGGNINGELAGDQAGYSVSLSADGARLAIGAIGHGTNSGRVRIYSWNGSAWLQMGSDINGDAAGNQAGHSVSLSADGARLAIGAIGHGGGAGNVRIYSWNGSAWLQMGSDINGEATGDQSGRSVSLSADGARLAIGAHLNDGGSVDSGHVRIYSWNGSAWLQMGSDINGEATGDQSGRSVSLSADGARLAIGAHLNDGGGNNSGHVRIYSWNGSAWLQMGSDINGEAIGDQSGSAVSMSANGARLAIGAHLNNRNVNSLDSGHVRVYSWKNSAWLQMGSEINGEETLDESGWSVSMSENGAAVAVGAYLNDGGGNNSGHVRVYGSVQSLFTPTTTTTTTTPTTTPPSTTPPSTTPPSTTPPSTTPTTTPPSTTPPSTTPPSTTPTTTPPSTTPPSTTPTPSPANPQQSPAQTPTPGVSNTTPEASVQSVSAPVSVTYRTGNSQVTLQWGEVSGAASYAVTQENGAQVCTTTTTSCSISQLRNGPAYNFYVFAVHANGRRSATNALVSARAGFQVKTTTVDRRRAVSVSSIVTTPSKGRKTWAVTSGGCRVTGARFVASPRAGSCRLRLSTTKSGAYAAMNTTITVTVR